MSVPLVSVLTMEPAPSADVLVPVLEVLLHLGHELAGVGAVDDAVIEAQRQVNEVADGD